MQNPPKPLFQAVGEHIQAFAWRIDMAHGVGLPENVLAKKVIRGLTPSILACMPSNRGPWTLPQLFWFADNLDQFLSQDDPHWKADATALPDFQRTIVNDEVTVTRENRPERKQASTTVKCYRCKNFGHFARKCVFPRVKTSIVKKNKLERK